MSDFFDALLFPKTRHEREADPGPFDDYQPYKPHLQREFRRKCVYCRISDGLKGYEGFGVEHYLPKSRFPALAAAWPNLFYACNVCNAWKGEAVSTPERFLPNPCDYSMADHLQYRDADIETYTPHGQWMSELLHLAERRDFREFVLAALGKFLTTRKQLLGDLVSYEERAQSMQGDEEIGSLLAVIRETVEDLERIDRHIERLTGEPTGSRVILESFG